MERCIREEVKAWGILAGIYCYIYCKDGGYVLVSCTLVECHGIIVSVGESRSLAATVASLDESVGLTAVAVL